MLQYYQPRRRPRSTRARRFINSGHGDVNGRGRRRRWPRRHRGEPLLRAARMSGVVENEALRAT